MNKNPQDYRARWIIAFCALIALGGVATRWPFASEESPSGEARSNPPETSLDSTVDYQPIRGEFQPLRLRRGGFTYTCNECHRTFESRPQRQKRVAEHQDIQLDHGRNDYCLNCHHRTNRDVYAAHDGSEISAERPAELCGKCHGLIYRDWEFGAHGKFVERWDSPQGERERLLCIQCHDPHAPQFPKLAPLPGPSAGLEH